MKHFLQILLIAVISLPAFAQQLSPEEALGRVRNMSGTAGAKATQKGKNQLVYTMQADNAAQGNLLYVFSDEESFVIAGADGQLPALIAYGNTAFPTDSIPANLRSWLDGYKTAFSTALAKGVTLSAAQGTGTPIVAPLVTAKWDQDQPFNNKCNDIGESSVTGCVATAMAQIMYYHKWPLTGTGSHSYSYNLNYGGGTKTISPSADFSQHTYDWNNMQDAYGSYKNENGEYGSMTYTDAQADGISTLLHDCGVAVNMLYAGGSSSASSANVPNALISYFGYDRGMSLEKKEYYTDEEWKNMIRTELNARRPVLYSGQTTKNEGHAFICDGYDDADYFHINWGWHGMANGYYLIVGTDALRPLFSGTGGSKDQLPYNEGNDVIIGIQKAQEGSDYNYFMFCNQPFTISPTEGTNSRPSIIIDGGFFNGSVVTATFNVGLRFKHKTADYQVDFKYPNSAKFAPNSGFSRYGFSVGTLTYKGEYEVYPIFRLNGTDEWKVMKYNKTWAIPVYTCTTGQEPPSSQEKVYHTVSITSDDNAKGSVSVQGVNNDGKAEKGSQVTATATPAEGYKFEKWSDGNTDNPRTITVDDNITIKAQFAAKQYTLTYKVDGNVYKTENVEYGTTLTAIDAPTKEGYTFSGWSTMPQTMPAQDITVSGTFAVNKYTLTYKVDGNVYKTENVEYGSTLTPIAAPTKEGYTFSGWSTMPQTMPAQDITVSGTFTVNKYKITYIYNGETVNEVTLDYGSEIPDYTYEPTNPYHTFLGWRTEGYTTMPAKDLIFIADFTDGISNINATAEGIRIYTISGKRTDKMTKGTNIIVYPDGRRIKKVIR